ncbi:hypothetical protein PV762_04960 [Mitsuaria sp. CC2]|uniref:hypothetical protein n=1 Tax=Mitsuaria sp. CC2 TaxID=3029186 RepID=UPI003B8C04EF
MLRASHLSLDRTQRHGERLSDGGLRHVTDIGQRQDLALRRLLPAGTDRDELIDFLWLLTIPDQWIRLTQNAGWSQERYAAWLEASAVLALWGRSDRPD